MTTMFKQICNNNYTRTCMCMENDLLDEENKELGFTITWIVSW